MFCFALHSIQSQLSHHNAVSRPQSSDHIPFPLRWGADRIVGVPLREVRHGPCIFARSPAVAGTSLVVATLFPLAGSKDRRRGLFAPCDERRQKRFWRRL